MIELDRKILELINARPGQKAKDIADALGVERNAVNSALYGRLKHLVTQCRNYRWYPKGNADARSAEGTSTALNTPLSRLCRYYLDCLSRDDLGGVSEFASSKYKDLKYIELPILPFGNQEFGLFDSQHTQELLARLKRDRNRQTLFLGYPVRLNLIRSKKGWEGLMVEPLLLFPFEETVSKYEKPALSDDLPQFNFKALRSLTNSNENLMEEAILLAEELGLCNVGEDRPDIDEILARMCDIRADWDWQEHINPANLSVGSPLSGLTQEGIYNRAILIPAERSPYTKGLESELGMLQTIDATKYLNTSLGAWTTNRTIESKTQDETSLLEVLPLNSEQRQAVQQAMSNQLTVITGPPGTGKSQVVSSILINAAWQGKKVLFASKNNKAVDVVETRVNALGPRPVLLRLGNNQFQAKLADYLVSLLSMTTTQEDQDTYGEFQSIQNQLKHRLESLDSELQKLIDTRNKVDLLEQQVECIRQVVGNELFHKFRTIDGDGLAFHATELQNAIHRTNKLAQSVVTQLFWCFMRGSRFSALNLLIDNFLCVSEYIGLPVPNQVPNQTSIEDWVSYGEILKVRVSQVKKTREYFNELEKLTTLRSIETLSKQHGELMRLLSSNSKNLWSAWLRLQSSRITRQQRKLLGDYSALLQLIVRANDQDRTIGQDVFRQYYKLFPQLAAILGCWAVTSLSARSKVPFEANFFDLLVIDEASQCDIASALPLLYRARRVVVIGDPMQLRHISTLSKLQDQQLMSKHNLLESHLGWAYSTCSLFDLASSLCRNEDIVVLRDHHRSHADIIEFSNKTFYEDRLRVATNYDRLQRLGNGQPAVRWIDVRGKASRPGIGGAVNEIEASAVVLEVERLFQQGYRGTIGVVSPFRAQANRIRDLVFNHQQLMDFTTRSDFLCDTVHKFQGDERDIIIFSPVIASGISSGSVGFLRSTPNLFNVAVTRARAALIVVGDRSAAIDCDVSYLSEYARYTESLKGRQVKSDEVDTTDFGPKYPKVSNPEYVSEWENIFYEAIYHAGMRPIPQYVVEKYVLDFAIIHGTRRLNIEIDGERYHRNWDGELCRRDQLRNQRLIELGWDVMRFWVYQVRDDLDYCINRVLDWKKGSSCF